MRVTEVVEGGGWIITPNSFAFRLAADSAGSSSAARMAMMAMTTSSSMSVKPREATARNAMLVRFLINERPFLD
jgi:hypothetical protein